jgi:RNase P subunit RPR2
VRSNERTTGAAERLHRRIEETRAIAGHTLGCSDCERLSSGRATGWTMRLGEDGHLYVFCPECDRLEFA